MEDHTLFSQENQWGTTRFSHLHEDQLNAEELLPLAMSFVLPGEAAAWRL